MSPILIQIGALKIYGYPFFMFLGFLIWTECSIFYLRNKGLNKNQIISLAFLSMISGLFGGRIMSILQNSNNKISDLAGFYRFWEAGLVVYGAIILSLICLVLYIKIKRLPLLKILDCFFLFFPLAMAIGRIGCYCQGCCYGIITDSSIGIRFPKLYSIKYGIIGSDAFIEHLNKGIIRYSDMLSLPVYPTQIISSISLLIIFLVLFLIKNKIETQGILMSLSILLYSLFRFFIEFIRSEPRYYFNFTLAQYISIIFICLSLIMIKCSKAQGQ